jgi:hypothetical protein
MFFRESPRFLTLFCPPVGDFDWSRVDSDDKPTGGVDIQGFWYGSVVESDIVSFS